MGLGGVAERIHPEDGNRLTEAIRDLTKDWNEGHRSTMSVYRWKRKDGEYRWFSDNSVFIRYSNEQPATLIGAVRDITAEKQAEEALRKRTHDLGERVKELKCLYGISNLVQRPDISLEEMLQGSGRPHSPKLAVSRGDLRTNHPRWSRVSDGELQRNGLEADQRHHREW